MKATEELMNGSEESQNEARGMLANLCINGFDGDLATAALALGRTEEEINGILGDDEVLDDDLIVKLRGIAIERDIEIE